VLVVVGFTAAERLAAGDGLVLKAERAGHVLVLSHVYLNGSGPLRMMIDTGNASSLIRPNVARRLSLRPAFAVEHVTVTGARKLPLAVLDEVVTGPLTETGVEVMIGDVWMDGVDGVLGENWLARHDYLFDYQNRRIVIDGVEFGQGLSIPFRSVNGRPVISIDVDGRPREVTLDSGAQLLTLFGCQPKFGANRAIEVSLLTNGASGSASLRSAEITLLGDRPFYVSAACVDHAGIGIGNETGLLPASMFRAIYVSNHNRLVRLWRR
jgi:hypothetical protein